MSSESKYFFMYKKFSASIPVFGIDNSTLYACSKDIIYLQSLSDVNNTAIHQFNNVWLVSDLNDFIISKHSTKQYHLSISLDNNENICLSFINFKSIFKVTTQSIDKITVFSHVQALVYQCSSTQRLSQRPLRQRIVRNIITASQRLSRISIPVKTLQHSQFQSSHAQLMHERLAHTSAKSLSLISIKYLSDNCSECVLSKQTRQSFNDVFNTASTRLFRVFFDLCGEIKPRSFEK